MVSGGGGGSRSGKSGAWRLLRSHKRHNLANCWAAWRLIIPARLDHLPHPIRKPNVARSGWSVAFQYSMDDCDI
jgi:hypothetical protein